MNNELKMQLNQAILEVYIDNEDDLRQDIEQIANDYKNGEYSSQDDMKDDVIAIVKEHLKVRLEM